MLEVYLLQQCDVVNMRVHANCCVELYASRKKRSVNNIGIKNFRFPHFSSIFVHTKNASNMAACYDDDVTDIITPHVYL